MRILAGAFTIALVAACRPSPPTAAATRALHTASARDSAFIRESCAMPDSVLAGTRPCIDRIQASNIRVF